MYNEKNTSPCHFTEVRLLLQNDMISNRMLTCVTDTVYAIVCEKRIVCGGWSCEGGFRGRWSLGWALNGKQGRPRVKLLCPEVSSYLVGQKYQGIFHY